MYQGIPGSGQYDLIVIALSAEPLAGWGKHLQNIRELYAGVSVTLSDGLPGTGMPAERVCGERGGKESRRRWF